MAGLPEWLTDPNYADTDYAVAPTTARREAGFTGDEYISAQQLNYILGQYSRAITALESGTYLVSAAAGEINVGATNGWTIMSNGYKRDYVAASQLHIAIPLRIGERLTEVRAYCLGTNVGAGTITFEVWKTTSAGVETQVGTTQTTANAATNQTLTIGSLTETGVSGTYYQAKFAGANANNGQALYAIEYVTDRG